MKKKRTQLTCAICGEATAGTPGYSLYGKVHKFGPREDHKFTLKEKKEK
jgi:hypothetical protein